MKLLLLVVSFHIAAIVIAMDSRSEKSAEDFLNWVKGGEPFCNRSYADTSLVFKRMLSEELDSQSDVRDAVFTKLDVVLATSDLLHSIHESAKKKRFFLKDNQKFVYFVFPNSIAVGFKKFLSMQQILGHYANKRAVVLSVPEGLENNEAWHMVLGAALGCPKDKGSVGLLAARFLAGDWFLQRDIILLIKNFEWTEMLTTSFEDFLDKARQRAVASFGENDSGAALFDAEWVQNISNDKCLNFVQKMMPIIIDKKDVVSESGEMFACWQVMDNGSLQCSVTSKQETLLFNIHPRVTWRNKKRRNSENCFEKQTQDFICGLESKTNANVLAISIDADYKIALAAIKKDAKTSVVVAKKYTKGSDLLNLTLQEISELL